MKKHFIHLVFVFIILFARNLVPTPSISQSQDNPWTIETVMPTARYDLSAAVVNGKIYVMGGQATGIGVGALASSKVEEYDPITNTWDTLKASIPTARNSFSSCPFNNKIYVFGGQTHAVTTNISSVEEYDPQTDTWDNTKILMPDKRVASSASLVSGKIYVIGGWNYVGSNIVTYGNVWEYDPATDTWDDTTRMDMPTPRAYLSTSVIDGKIYAFGGSNETTALSTVKVYDPFTNTWTPKSDMPAGRTYLMTSAVEDSLIYIFGGSTSPFDKPMSDAWAYNPGSDKFKAVSPMPTGLITSTCNAVDEKIYIIGGSRTPWIFQSDSLLLEYDPHNDSSSSLTAIEKWDTNLPTAFSLSQNYPNPFNPTTTIEFSIPNSEFITLKIYNLLGQEVAILVSEKLKTGSYKYTWDATHYSSGIYYYKIKASKFEKTEKMILLQ